MFLYIKCIIYIYFKKNILAIRNKVKAKMCSRIELFVSLQNIPPTAAECIWSWVQQCPLLPAVSYKGPTQCPGAPFEPENRDASDKHMQKNSFLAYGALGLCVCTWALLLNVVFRALALDSAFISSCCLVMLLVRVVRVCMIRALSSAFMDLFFSSLDISSWRHTQVSIPNF